MGIYGALSSAVTGLRAQSHALENISGNIANSQTTGYKRIETDFLDLIPDAPVRRQVPGAVLAQSRGTNGEAGDIKTVSNETYIALNSNGFFVVEPKSGQSDGNSVFAGTNFYTRRGDFEIDKDGYLVNGAGYYLKGLPIDPGTGNISGSVPEVIKLSNAFLPAQQTNRINYQANLPQLPKPSNYKATVPNSELFRAADYDPAATFTPARSVSNAAYPTTVADLAGDTLTVTMGGAPFTYHFVNGGTIPTDNATNRYINTSVAPNDTVAGVLTNIQSHMNGRTNGSGSTVALDGTGRLVVTMPPNSGVSLAVSATDGSTATPTPVAFTDSAPVSSVPYGSPIETISANQNTQFLSNSISGGAITVYAENGAPANVQMRWAKVSSTATGGADVWHLYYMSNSNAANGEPMWSRVPENFQFAPNGSLASPTSGATTLSNLTVNGVSIGDVEFRYDTNGLSQFADVNGTANVSTLNQNGYGAGEFVSVAINDNGRVVATYSNGERIDMAQVVTAEFNAINQLKRLDGGVFSSTSESGEAILDLSGSGILGGSLEASNTDISDEFTKLIVTQQAYAAGTRIVSTADEMLQEALNMIR